MRELLLGHNSRLDTIAEVKSQLWELVLAYPPPGAEINEWTLA